MYRRDRQINKDQVALVQTARRKAGLGDDLYRELLGSVGCEHTRELTQEKLDYVLGRLREAGWRPPEKPRPGLRQPPEKKESRERQIRKIQAQLHALDRPLSYADVLALKICKVERLEWVDTADLYKIITALAKQQGREE